MGDKWVAINSKVAPLHIVADQSPLQTFQYVIAKSKDKNPLGNLSINVYNSQKLNKWRIEDGDQFENNTPLHIAAMNGNVEVCRLILDNVDNFNPKN